MTSRTLQGNGQAAGPRAVVLARQIENASEMLRSPLEDIAGTEARRS
jgi:hypothetical protein